MGVFVSNLSPRSYPKSFFHGDMLHAHQLMPMYTRYHNITRGRRYAKNITQTTSSHMLVFVIDRQFEAHKKFMQGIGGVISQSAGAFSSEGTWQWSSLVQLESWVSTFFQILLVFLSVDLTLYNILLQTYFQ
jgi:hypothetical protein